MSKIAKAKRREPSIHSRAARRAGSPSLNTDKSLKNATPPSSNPHTHIFAAKNAGIRKKKHKQLTRGQIVRQKRGVERADIVKERLDSKLEKSLGKLKTIKERARNWEVLNGEVVIKKPSKFAALGDENEKLVGEWEDVVDSPLKTEGGNEDAVKPPETEMVIELPHRAGQIIPTANEIAEEEVDEVL